MNIEKNSIVTMHYELKDDQGTVLDSSKDKDPLVYMQGTGNIIVGLEEELDGKKTGDSLAVKVSAEKAYGMPVAALVQQVPIDTFGDDVENIDVGMRFQADTEQGPVPVVVTEIEDGMVTVDGNHPLAGKELHFDVSIVEVRAASDEEKEHGHPHGPGGHQH